MGIFFWFERWGLAAAEDHIALKYNWAAVGEELVMKKTHLMIVLAVALMFTASTAMADQLWNNGPLITNPGGGAGGNDASRLQTGEGTLGYGHQLLPSINNRVADDFTVPAGPGWRIDNVKFFAYQTGAMQSGSLTAYNVNLCDGGGPGLGTCTNFSTLNSTGFSGIYRDTQTTAGDSGRAIQLSEVDFGGIVLAPGDYWLDWQVDGTLTSGPWAPPVTWADGSFNKPNPNGDPCQRYAVTDWWCIRTRARFRQRCGRRIPVHHSWRGRSRTKQPGATLGRPLSVPPPLGEIDAKNIQPGLGGERAVQPFF